MSKKLKFVTISLRHEQRLEGVESLCFLSKASLTGYDIIIFFPPDSIEYSKVAEYSRYWKEQLLNAYEKGKVIFFVSTCDPTYTYFRKRGSDEYVYTYSLIPDILIGENNSIKTQKMIGRDVCLREDNSLKERDFFPAIKNLIFCLEEYISYNFIYDFEKNTQIIKLFETKDSSYCLGGIFQNDKKGSFILFPSIYTLYGYYTEEGIDISLAIEEGLISLYRATHEKEEPAPDWVLEDKYKTSKEKKLEEKILEIEETIEKQEEEKEVNISKKKESQELKKLLYSGGKPLEKAVIKGLKILGLEGNHGYKKGDFEIDCLIEHEGRTIIIEVGGKETKGISPKKVTQVVTNIDLYVDENKSIDVKDVKGILFGNVDRFTEIEKRNSSFTKEAIGRAKKNNISLILTKDLFTVAKYVEDSGNTAFAEKCIKAMLDKDGVVNFSEIPKN